MSVAIVRICGAILGYVIAHSILLQSVGAESWMVPYDLLWLIIGGWIVTLSFDLTGIVIGYFALLPLINVSGTAILRFSETIRDRR